MTPDDFARDLARLAELARSARERLDAVSRDVEALGQVIDEIAKPAADAATSRSTSEGTMAQVGVLSK